MPTDKRRIRELVLDIMVDQLGIPKDSLLLSTTFKNLGADSLDAVELVLELEEEFDISIPDEDAEKIQTVGEAIKYIEDAIQNRHGVKPGYAPAGAMWYSIVPFSSINDDRHEYAIQNGFRIGEKIYFKSYPASIVNHYWDQVNNRWVKYDYGSWLYNFYNHLRDVTTGKEVVIGSCGTLISDVWAEKARKAGVEPHWQHEAFNNLPKIVETTRPIIARGGTRIGTACEVTSVKSVKTSNFRVKEHVHFYWMEEKSLFCGRIDSLDSQHYNDVHIKRCGDGQICKVGSKNCISNDSCEVIINDELHNPAVWYRNKERKKGQVYIEWLKKHIDPVYLLKMAAELENHAKSELQKVVATLGKKPLSKEQYGRRSDSTK